MTDSARPAGDAGGVRWQRGADWYGSAHSRRARLAVVLALAGGYVAAFVALYEAAGSGLLALSVLPVGAAGWLFGLRGGLVSAVAVVLLSGLLLRFAGDDAWNAARWTGTILRAGALVMVGLAVGRLRDLGRRLQEENAERTAAVAALRRSEGQLQMMVQHTLDIITVLGPDGTILYESPSVRQVLGYEVSERMGRSVFEMVHPDDRGQIAASFQEAVQRPGPAPTVVFRFRHKNGDWRYLEAMGNHVRDAAGAVTVVVNSRDVTERTYAAAQLQEMVRLKDELVSVVSHELRNPLTAMVGFAELLMTRTFDEQKRSDLLTTIMREGRRISALIDDFLDLQRMEGGAQRIEPEPINLRVLLQGAADGAGEDPERPITVHAPAGLPQAFADPARIQQVLANLLSNARKYSPGGGPVLLSARADGDGMIEVAVSDQGLGIPLEALPRLFAKFYRVDGAERETIKGTGLGLAICRELVVRHGGSIWAESAGQGRGARFCFTLPAMTPLASVMPLLPGAPGAPSTAASGTADESPRP